VQELLIVHDHDSGYGVPVGAMCARAARERGLSVALRPVWNQATWLLGSEGVADSRLAAALEPPVAERTRFFVAQHAPAGFYGFEAMALILDSIVAGEGDRRAVARSARSTRDRDSVLGHYSIDADGHTTSTVYGCLAVAAGQLVWADPISG
jgi:hypothetical protein